jgi:hypothetical protein
MKLKEPIIQQNEYGCGVACFAFSLNLTYLQAAKILGQRQTKSERFYVKDLVGQLNLIKKGYIHKYVKPKILPRIYQEGVIVLVARSKLHPTGHYLVRHGGLWMDPWMNLSKCKQISKAAGGYRKRLPSRAMYAIFPPGTNL